MTAIAIILGVILMTTPAWAQGYFGGGAPGGLSGGTNHAFPSSGVPSCAWSAESRCKTAPQPVKPTRKVKVQHGR